MKSKLLTIFLFWGAAFAAKPADTNRFLEAGIPATDREWIGADYLRVAEVFKSGELALPRLSDANGRAVLQRLTSTNNFSMNLDTHLPVQRRLEDSTDIQEGAGAMFKLYLIEANRGEQVHEELARMLVFNLYVCALEIQLADEFLPKIPKDETYEIRMDGFRKMKSGLTTVYVGAELSLSERNLYSANDLSRILDGMADTLPTVETAFSQAYRSELRKKLETDKLSFKNEKDVRRIDEMIAVLK